jgi:ferric-dicitrate binding protein FerR (iron transport regulator)
VEVKGPGAAEWKAAEAGQTLEKDFLISTGFKSTALLTIGNSTVTVKPLTRLSLEEIVMKQHGEQVALNLRAGRVRAEVAAPAGGKTDFTVRSPVATASVRGTVFEFDGMRLSVEEGRVHLTGEGVTGAYIGKGHATTVDTETGKTATAAEAVKEDLVPASPAGLDTVPSGTTTTVPVNGGLGIGLEWE